MGGFSLPGLTVGGGSSFSALLAQLLGELGQQRNVRAGLASDLFGQLLGATQEANRRPISFVDQLLLGGEVGSPYALSQASQEQLGRYTSRPQGSLLSDLARRLNLYTVGALTPSQQVSEGFNPNTGVELTPKESEYIRIAGMSPTERTQDAVRRGVNPVTGAPLTEQEKAYIHQVGKGPQQMQYGGSLVIDPRKLVSTASTVAGPARLTDRKGQPIADIGEGKDPERLDVKPIPSMTTFGPEKAAPTVTSPAATSTSPGMEMLKLTQSLPLDVRFRFEAITNARPDLPEDARLNIARNPGGFEQYIGVKTDPRTSAARLLGSSLSGDQRLTPSLVRSLALGRAPSPADLNARDFASLPPDIQESLFSVIGPDLARQFMFELAGFTPTGTRTRIAGPVAA